MKSTLLINIIVLTIFVPLINSQMMKLDRSAAINLLYQYVKNEKMVFHCLASEAVMQGLARKLGRDEESWGLAIESMLPVAEDIGL